MDFHIEHREEAWKLTNWLSGAGTFSKHLYLGILISVFTVAARDSHLINNTSNSNHRLKSAIDMPICVLKRGDLCDRMSSRENEARFLHQNEVNLRNISTAINGRSCDLSFAGGFLLAFRLHCEVTVELLEIAIIIF